jgi:hypothetical protein
MVTNYPQQLAAAAEVTFERTGNAVARGMARLGQLICGLNGHDAVVHFSKLVMRCTSCGHETPGWEIGGRGPRRRFEGDAHRHLLSTRIVASRSRIVASR